MAKPSVVPIVFFPAALGALYGLARENYLFFHVLVELCTVVVAVAGFAVVWTARAQIENGFFLVLGIGLLPVAGLTLLHSLTYKGMGVFPGLSADPPTQLWVASRVLLAFFMLLGAFLMDRRPRSGFLLVLGCLSALALASGVFLVPLFPSCFLEGQGLTGFKILAEYGICVLLGLSGWLLWRARHRFDGYVLRLLLWALAAGIASELSFTLYTDVYGLMNLVGHLLSVVLFGLLFQAIVRVGIQRPQDLLLRELALRETALRESEAICSTAFRANPEAMVIFRLQDGRIREVNEGFLRLTGYAREEVVGRTAQELGIWTNARERASFMGALARDGLVRDREVRFGLPSGEFRIVQISAEVLEIGGESCVIAVTRDITRQTEAEESLRRTLLELEEARAELEEALARAKRREQEVRGLLDAARTVMDTKDLAGTMRFLYDSCKELVGARAGYVALLSGDGESMEALFLDSGGEPCQVAPATPMPVRGLRAKAVASMAPVIENHFHNTRFPEFLPPGHQPLYSVLFAPLVMGGTVVGLLGLANKPGGFTQEDARLSMAFGEMAAVALQNSRYLDALQQSEQRLRSLVESARDAIFSVDNRGRIILWNPAAETIFGYEASEILGRPLEVILPEGFREENRQNVLGAILEGKLHPQGAGEFCALRKDGSKFPVELSLAGWQSKGERFFTGIVRDVTERKQVELELRRSREELEERVAKRTEELAESNQALRAEIERRSRIQERLKSSQEELKKLSAALLSAQETERKNVAQEIHDSVGQILAAIKFTTERALLELPTDTPPGARRSLQDVVAMVQGAVEEVRRIQMDLRPAVLDDLGLVATIGWFCREFQKVYSNIKVEKQLEVEEKDLPGPLKIVIFRVLQEAFNNAAKHSGADQVVVSLRTEDSELCLIVEDNGRGMPLEERAQEAPPSHGGMGILGMKERVELSGGRFSLQSEPGKGTRVQGKWRLAKGGPHPFEPI